MSSVELWTAAYNDHVDAIRDLVRAGADIEYVGSYGATPLSIAAEGGNVMSVALLLSLGANANTTRYTTGATPLIIAAQNGFDKIIHELLLKGADINAQKKNGATALYMAVEGKHVDTVKCLLENGADPEIADANDVNPLKLAQQTGQQAMIKMLMKMEDSQSLNHSYVRATSMAPKKCSFCNGTIWSPMHTLFLCQVCKARAHKSCIKTNTSGCPGVEYHGSLDKHHLCLEGESIFIPELINQILESPMRREEKRSHYQTFQCYTGDKIIDWLTRNRSLTKELAVKLIILLVERGNMFIVKGDKKDYDSDDVWLEVKPSEKRAPKKFLHRFRIPSTKSVTKLPQQKSAGHVNAAVGEEVTGHPLYKMIRSFFMEYTNNQDSIDIQGLPPLCYRLGVYYTRDQIAVEFEAPISFDVFFSWYLRNDRFRNIPDIEERLQFYEVVDTFRQYDSDESGTLDVEELSKLFYDQDYEYTRDQVLEELGKLDSDGNGEIELEEWLVSRGY
eukprot:TRINITY_DN8901_c0_g1_i1.p1 TRINITY_DN8901_c0_g1~~TRINITY_DN8901_c0_g1_i1.p1  ORF type:complete len:504 (-),score=70.85 TRINITY_DN8901_c0_g1_i1:70-1581(-)